MPTPQELAAELSQERFALAAVLEFARTLTPDLGPREIMHSALHAMMGKSLISEAFAYLAKDGNFELVARAGFSQKAFPELLDQNEFDRFLEDKTHPYTALPLIAADGTGYLGLLGLGRSMNPKLSGESEATYLASLAALTAIALTNAWLFEREKERERFESELRLAREIQESLLPQKLPQISGAEFAALSWPSEWVGGDYYDTIELGDSRVLVAVADVVGKGITAALTMANLQAALRALVMLLREGHLTLLEVVNELNRMICESTAPERFITAAFGVLDVRAQTYESVVCGHPNPIMIVNDTAEFAESTGIPLGIVPTYPFDVCKYDLSSGSLLVLYTDGLSEAIDGGKHLGEKGMERMALDIANAAGDLDSLLRNAVGSERISIADDVTLVAVRLG